LHCPQLQICFKVKLVFSNQSSTATMSKQGPAATKICQGSNQPNTDMACRNTWEDTQNFYIIN